MFEFRKEYIGWPLLILVASANVFAEVKDFGRTGFAIEMSRQTDNTINDVYAQFLKVGEWWNAEHSYFGKSENFSLDAQAGGCFCERDGQRQVLHMTVTYVDPGREVRMVGGLGPLQMMGASGGMSWSFEETSSGTKVTHRYRVSGHFDGLVESLATAVDSVQQGQLAALIDKVESTQ